MSEKTLTTGQRIKFARQEAGWTQRQLVTAYNEFYRNDIADKAMNALHQPALARYESGSTAGHSSIIDRIMTVLRNAGATIVTDSVDGVLGIQARTAGKLIPVTDLLSAPAAKEWLAEGFIARRFTTILAGQEGSGKSMLTQTLAVAWASGHSEAFGFRLPGRPLRGLVLDVENVVALKDDETESGIVKERLQKFAGGLTEDSVTNLTVTACLGFDLDKDSEGLDAVLADAERNGTPYDFVICDSFRSLWTSGSENTPEAGRVLAKLNRIAATRNVALIILHHTNKAGAAYSGHTSIGSTVSGALWTFSTLMQKDPNTGKKVGHKSARFLNPYKVRIAAQTSGRIVFTSDTGIQSAKSAEEYEGFEIDPGTDDTEGTDNA